MERIRILACALLALVCLSAAADSGQLSWTWRNPLPSPDAFTVIASGGGIYVAAGQDGVIYHSADGINWLQVKRPPLGMGGEYLDAIYANGIFLLAGTDAAGTPHVSTSSDGVTWADTKLGFDADDIAPSLQLAFGNGIYLVMGENGEATSHDAVTWTLHGLSFADVSFDNPIVFANGVFIVEGDPPSGPAKYSGTIFFSSDGVNWTESSVDTQGNLAADGTTFIMVRVDPSVVHIYTSSDGDHWSKKVATGDAPQDLLEVQWDGTRFLGLGFLPVSPFVTPNASYSSPDGIAWTLLSSSLPSDIRLVGPHSFTTMGSTYTSVASGALQIARSTDFVNWSTVFSGSSGPKFDLADITYGGGHFVAVGHTSNGLPAIMESTDGSAWTTALSSGTPSDLTTVAFGKGLYVAAGSGDWFSSPDAVAWTAITAHPETVHTDVVYGNGMFLAFAGGATVSSTDGKTWTTGVKAPAATLAYDGTRFVSVGSDSGETGKAPVYTSCDGASWSHSADIGVAKGDSFLRVRPTSKGLVAMGSQACSGDPRACLGPEPPVIATSEDSSSWTAHELGGAVSDTSFMDVTFAGSNYYAVAGLGGGDPADPAGLIYTSTDAATWTPLSGAPFTTFDGGATFNALATDGNHLVAVGPGGGIISASVAGGSLPTSGPTCTALPAVSSSSSRGSFSVCTLAGLLGLLFLRRRLVA
jgi:hypothetical protein